MFIKRIIENQIIDRLYKNKAIIIFGPRQSGKTTLVRAILDKIQKKSIILNSDEPDIRTVLTDANSTELRNIIGDNEIVFIDEAQRVPNIGLTLKLIVDNIKNVQLIASGSSSFELANRIQESLTGRKFEYFLYPLSFEELVMHQGLMDEKRLLETRLVYGYYPEIVTKPGYEKELLKLLASSYLYKDLLSMENIKKTSLLEKIVKALALQLGNEVKYSEIAQLTGSDKETVEKYIDLLEKAYVVFKLSSLSRNHRNEIKKGKKIYFYDIGIRNAVISNFSPINARTDTGALWENFFISERMKYLANHSIYNTSYFWRTFQQQEVDYIEEREQKIYAYEIKWNHKSKFKIPANFIKSYQATETHLINNQNFDKHLLDEY